MEEKPKQSAKQRVLAARGKDVPLDLFLYSCLERERLVKAKAKTNAPKVRWPVLDPVFEGGELPGDAKDMAISGVVNRLVAWYRTEFPELTEGGALDHEKLSEVVPGVVGLNTDLGLLYKAKTGEDLPPFEGSVGNNAFWDEITSTIEKSFPTRAKYVLAYVRWAHAAEQKEEFEPGSRPPVGRYAPPPLRREGGRFGGKGDRGGRGGDRGGRGDRGPRDRDRGPRREGGSGGDRPPREDRPPHPTDDAPREAAADEGGDREPRGDRPPRRDRGERGDRGPRDRDRGPRRDRGDRGDRGGPNDEVTQKMTEAALAEVDRAIDTLKGDKSVEEVTLKPANSFYRRIQHQKIVDSGYHSFSVGEGPDRAVKVARKE